jgi:hypothetical protein
MSTVENNIKIIDYNYINKRISAEICNDTINKLSDKMLLDEYKECKSVKNKIYTLDKILEKFHITNDKKELIINDYLSELIPAGTKGVIRGNKFNNIVKKTIKDMHLDNKLFEICFEKQCSLINTSEIPDWFILDRINNKILIGMNQLDLWRGGQQLNRGSKYLINNKINSENSKLLCVVCNDIKFNSNNKSKAYKLFEIGFTNNTLCYLKNLPNIISEYFNQPTLY